MKLGGKELWVCMCSLCVLLILILWRCSQS
nr:MAG TPA: hypothetical protein [Caudoviricetes sp.]